MRKRNKAPFCLSREGGSKLNAQGTLADLAKEAIRKGATKARIISARDVVLDARVRFKCSIPVCSGYGRNLMCPPNVISVEDFRHILSLYKHALLLQVETNFDSRDKSKECLTEDLCREIERRTGTARWQRNLHDLVNALEATAFKKGYRFAAGLIGGECILCEECVAVRGGRTCVHPFRARPSLEAVGVDVVSTCQKAGMPIELSSRTKVRWTGLVLLD